MNPQEVKSILLFKLRYMGDVLMTTPAIRLLRQSYPKASITMIVNKGTEDVLRYNPHLDQIVTIDREMVEKKPFYKRVPYEWKVLRDLRRGHYNISVDFDSGERGAYMALLSGIGIRIGFHYSKGFRRLIFTHQVHREGVSHTVERNLLLVEKTMGLVRTDDTLELYTGPEDDRRMALWLQRHQLSGKDFVIIQPGARFSSKLWPAEKWASLIDILQKDLRLHVVVTGGQKEIKYLQTIMSGIKARVLSLVGQTTVLELAVLLKKASLFIGTDSGPMHIAAAVGTPLIALFGPTDPLVWGPWGKGHYVISRYLPCSPCKYTHCNLGKESCMEQISIEDVLNAVCQHFERPLPLQ